MENNGPLRLRALVARLQEAITDEERLYVLDQNEYLPLLKEARDALLSAPVVSPPTLYETASPEHRAIVDRVMQRVQVARTKAQAIGGGRSAIQEDDSQRLWACGCYEDQGGYHLCWTHASAPVVSGTKQIADPEPDLPPDECTTADMLRKIATHMETGALKTDATLNAAEWIGGLRERAHRLDIRAAPVVTQEGE